MRRDMDLVREILKETAESEVPLQVRELEHDEWSFQDIAYHVKIMRDAGLIEATVTRKAGGPYVSAVVDSLTWEGNEFLDAVENKEVWKRVRREVAKYAGRATFAIVKALAEKELSALFPE